MGSVDLTGKRILDSLPFRMVLIFCAMSSVLALALMVASNLHHDSSMILCVFSVTAVPTILGHIFSEYPTGGELALARYALGTMVRTGPILILLFIVSQVSPSTLKGGLIGYLVLFYLVGLFADVVLSFCRLNQPVIPNSETKE